MSAVDPFGPLVETLPALQRMALAYAPASTRVPTLALLALDTRLGGIVRNSREPMLAQLRLSWWREQLGRDLQSWPEGEPLLAALRSWGPQVKDLAGLVDGWERVTGAAPLPEEAFSGLAEARGRAFAGLADVLGMQDQRQLALRFGRNWALADLAQRVSNESETLGVLRQARSQDWSSARLPRSLRPLAVLHGLARRGLERSGAGAVQSPTDLVVALRIGLIGR